MGKITGTGLYQGDLYTFLSNTVTLCNELKDDVDAMKNTMSALLVKIDADFSSDSGYASCLGREGKTTADRIVADVAASDLSLTIT